MRASPLKNNRLSITNYRAVLQRSRPRIWWWLTSIVTPLKSPSGVLALNGVAFVSALGGVVNGIWQDYANLWGIGFLVLFSASFVVTDELPADKYEPRFFILDCLEVVLIFFAYWFLGLADTGPALQCFARVTC